MVILKDNDCDLVWKGCELEGKPEECVKLILKDIIEAVEICKDRTIKEGG